jgi:Uncharacterized conserved protein (some members contain a von Willebrand factor type A (vWA) domain)
MPPHNRKAENFPVTKTGVAYIVCGIILFLSGLYRGELVSSICGCTLLLYALFCLFCAMNGVHKWKKARFFLFWEDKNTALLKLTEMNQAPIRRSFFASAFFECSFLIGPKNGYVFPFKLSVLVEKPEIHHAFDLPPRGIYHPEKSAIIIKDFSAFFKFAIALPESMNPNPLEVFPEPEEPGYIPLPSGQTGISQGKSTFHRSDELYETRPYMPGDDPRKINWKVSAHTGNHILREGELLPPPSAEYVFIFNTCVANRKVSPRIVKNNFDLLIARATFLAQMLSARNKIISIACIGPHEEAYLTTVNPHDPEAKTALLRALAFPQPEAAKMEQINAKRLFAREAAYLLFTMPECAIPSGLDSFPKNSSLILCGPTTDSSQYLDKVQTLCKQLSSGGFNVAQI